MLSIILSCIPVIVYAEHILTIIIAMARGVSRSTDRNVVEISTIYARHILLILNVIKMSVYTYNILGGYYKSKKDLIN